MKPSYTPEAEAYRLKVQSFLKDNLPKDWKGTGSLEGKPLEEFIMQWRQVLAKGGYLAMGWPKQYGGGGLSALEQVIAAEEFERAGVPTGGPNDVFSIQMLGNTLLLFGTEEQKQHYLPRIISGDDVWCQGYSEPNAGSDLSNVGLKAVLDGDEWILNGQKIWTSAGHLADHIFTLARTDSDAPKHKGISYLLVPMRQEGVEVRGIVQPDGTAEFCEVFFTNARCPKDNVVGGVNNGWKVTNSTLAFERGMSATTGYRRFEEEYKMMVRVATENGTIEHDDIRQRLMQYYTKIQLLRINGLRSLTATLNNSKDFGVMALGASNKMFWSEMHKAAMELALDIFGAQGMLVDAGPETGSWPGVAREKRREGYPVSPMMSAFFFSRSETIWGGTSQIQRNIVGERVLGLPKEPSAG